MGYLTGALERLQRPVLQDKATGGFRVWETSDLEPNEQDMALGVDPSVNILKAGF